MQYYPLQVAFLFLPEERPLKRTDGVSAHSVKGPASPSEATERAWSACAHLSDAENHHLTTPGALRAQPHFRTTSCAPSHARPSLYRYRSTRNCSFFQLLSQEFLQKICCFSSPSGRDFTSQILISNTFSQEKLHKQWENFYSDYLHL